VAAERAASRDLIGYFTDEELNWAQPDGEAGEAAGTRAPRPSLLQICLSLEPSYPAYHAAWEFTLAAHGGEIATLARAWGVDLPNKEALRQLTLADAAVPGAGYRRDQDRFAREFAGRYFSVAAKALRRHDPNHLILGCRFAADPGAAILAECGPPQVDVLSLGADDETLPARIEAAHAARGMPVLVGEFGWTGAAFKREAAAGEAPERTTIERMLARGRATLERAVVHPATVGYAWPRWADRDGQRAPFGDGLVHIDDREAHEHTELFSLLNRRCAALRLAAASSPLP
jgi:hypothetical protein